jgi:hypothetical protein
LFSDLGLPRTAFKGTIAFICDAVRGRASGSLFAARRILRSSSTVGNKIWRLTEVLDIVLHFPTFRVAEADASAYLTPIDKGGEIQAVPVRNKPDQAQLAVREAFIDPDERLIPYELLRKRQGEPVALGIFGDL